MIRWASRALLLAAVGLVVVAGYRWREESRFDHRPDPSPVLGFVVEQPDRDLGVLPVGNSVEVAYLITNTGPGPIRLIGSAGGGCGVNCCFGPKYAEEINRRPIVIPPRETLHFPCELDIRQPGPIEWKMTLFLEDNGIRNVQIGVRGTAVAAGGPKDGAPKP
jgi:hypothetical protein